jgi:O-antigen ligase
MWTENLVLGLKIIEKSIPFFIIPFSVFILKPFKTINQLKKFNKTFITVTVFLVCVTLLYIVYNISAIVTSENNYNMVNNLRNSIEMVPLIGEHPIYFSLLIAMALLLLFYNKFYSKVLNIICSLFLTFGLILASSKGVIIALVVVSVLIIFQEIKNKRKAFFVLLLVGVGISSLVYFSPLRSRIEKEIIENQFTYPQGIHFNSFNLRTAIYNCSFSLVHKSGLIGFTPGDLQQELNECYKKFNTPAFNKINYNTHNQYLDYLLSFGFFGLLLIICVFYYYLRIAMNRKNKLYFNFLILLYIVLFTENILSRNTGIVLFVTFNSLLGYYNLQSLNLKHDNS